jgi:vancomycin permeability regulator SanA
MISGEDDEVRIMKNYLTFNGISPDIIIEDQASDNTFDTVTHCAEYIESMELTEGVVFISQKYHIPRIALLARRSHIRNAYFVVTRRRM